MEQILPTYIVHFGGNASGNVFAGGKKGTVPKMTLIYNNKDGTGAYGNDCYEDGYGEEYEEDDDDDDGEYY